MQFEIEQHRVAIICLIDLVDRLSLEVDCGDSVKNLLEQVRKVMEQP